MSGEELHKNHRQRMYQKVEEYGLESLPAHEVLEYLLFFAIPRCNTNPIAHRLLERFGDFCQVLEASPDELAQVEGMGPASARFLHSLLQVSRYYQMEKRRQTKQLKTEEQAIEYVKPLFIGEREEVLYAVILDDKGTILRTRQVGRGVANAVEVSAGRLAKTALMAGGTSVILAHNHPAGLPIPSSEDIITTGKMVKALGILGIDLIDHIVVAGQEATSMVQRQCMPIYDPVRGEVEYPRRR